MTPKLISEKTVELNLTTELTNWLWKRLRAEFVAISPSQREEGRLGFDVSMQASGFAFFVQYKRAHLHGVKYTYYLNRTSTKDQHAKLLRLEKTGVPVFYALPLFTTDLDVFTLRRKLLLHTLWLSPSDIPVPNGGVGWHEVHYNSSTKKFCVSSDDRIEFKPSFYDINALSVLLGRGIHADNLVSSMRLFNELFIGPTDRAKVKEKEYDDSLATGISLVATLHSK